MPHEYGQKHELLALLSQQPSLIISHHNVFGKVINQEFHKEAHVLLKYQDLLEFHF